MSPKNRGRKRRLSTRKASHTPQQQVSVEQALAQIFDRLLRDAGTDLAELDDLLEAELLFSEVVGTWSGQFLIDGDPEVIFGEGLIDHVERAGTPAALAVLRGFVALGTDDQRRAATAAAARLVGRGVVEPDWAVWPAPLAVTGCWTYSDVYADQTSVLLGYQRNEQAHGIVVLIDHTLGGLAKDAFVVDDPDAALASIRAQSGRLRVTLREITPSAARGLVEAAFEATDTMIDPPLSETFQGTRALALARLRALPEPVLRPVPVETGPAERERIVRDFLASDQAAELTDRVAARRCAGLIVDYGCDEDAGQPLRVSPMKTEVFLYDWLPHAVPLTEAEQAAMSEVIRAWVRWAGRRSGLPASCLTELDEAAEQFGADFPEAYADPERESSLRALLSDLDDLADADELQAALERRLFAMPYNSVTIGEESFSHLDPSDEDDRHLLILSEHPEYQEALDDPPFEGEVDGVDPRLHVAMHEIIANQLWHDDPPETWQAVQRLIATGADRHDILHRVGEIMIPHLYGAMSGQSPDPDAYRRELDALGRDPAGSPSSRSRSAARPSSRPSSRRR